MQICSLVTHQWAALWLSVSVEAIAAGLFGIIRLATPLKLALVMGSATLVTHPFVWGLFAAGDRYLSYSTLLWGVELFVVGLEALLLSWVMRYTVAKSLGISLLTNACSLLLGLFIAHGFNCQLAW